MTRFAMTSTHDTFPLSAWVSGISLVVKDEKVTMSVTENIRVFEFDYTGEDYTGKEGEECPFAAVIDRDDAFEAIRKLEAERDELKERLVRANNSWVEASDRAEKKC